MFGIKYLYQYEYLQFQIKMTGAAAAHAHAAPAAPVHAHAAGPAAGYVSFAELWQTDLEVRYTNRIFMI